MEKASITREDGVLVEITKHKNTNQLTVAHNRIHVRISEGEDPQPYLDRAEIVRNTLIKHGILKTLRTGNKIGISRRFITGTNKTHDFYCFDEQGNILPDN